MTQKTIVDPRQLLEAESVGFGEAKEGDWIAAGTWRRPRLVLIEEQRDGERVLFLSEPDNADGSPRLVTELEWDRRGEWRRYTHLRAVWDAAHKA
jgi:hypothetical protein